jgi:Xaa-Pro dipeptidase
MPCTIQALLSNPMNVRYATDTHYAQITNMHSPVRFVFVPGEGKAILYDSMTDDFEPLPDVIGEQREATVSAYFIAGEAYAEGNETRRNETRKRDQDTHEIDIA